VVARKNAAGPPVIPRRGHRGGPRFSSPVAPRGATGEENSAAAGAYCIDASSMKKLSVPEVVST
jgi:hypothetical protein